MLRTRWSYLALAASVVCASPAQVRAQPGLRRLYGGERVIELSARERWLHEREQPAFAPHIATQWAVFIDSIRVDDLARRTYHLHVSSAGASGDPGRIVVATDGRTLGIESSLGAMRPTPSWDEEMVASLRRYRLLVGNDGVMLPSATLWDLVPAFHPARAQQNASWIDTIDYSTSVDGFVQRLRGTRISRIVRDTVAEGRRRWIVRDSAAVAYEERWRTREYTLDSLVTVERSARGTIRGEYLFDDSLKLFERRVDTTALAGTATLRYVNGRAYRTPARFERVRRWDLLTPQRYATLMAARQDSARRRRGGMVRDPSTDLESRLAAGDTVVRDSLVGVWVATDDVEGRSEIERTLRWAWARGDGRDFWQRVRARRIAAGDLKYLLQTAGRGDDAPGIRFNVAEMQQLVDLAERPEWLFAHGILAEEPISAIANPFVQVPPAVTPDTARWPCVPDACRFLAGRWRSSSDPRVRDLGLLAALMLDPRRWADTVRRRARSNHAFFAGALQLVDGVGATWPAATQAPLPPPGADWRAWLDWMDGRNPRFPADPAPIAIPASRFFLKTPRFEKSHENALRFASLVTARDIIGELRGRFAAATGDSAQLVFGTVLAALNEWSTTDDELVQHFRSGTPVRVALAGRELSVRVEGFYRKKYAAKSTSPRVVPDSTTVMQLLDRLTAVHVEGERPWLTIAQRSDSSLAQYALGQIPMRETRRSKAYLLASGLPQALLDKWKGRATAVTEAEWRRMPAREAGDLYTFAPVERLGGGSFVLLSVETAGKIARPDDMPPYRWASSDTYVLMELEGEWFIVYRMGSIT